MKTLLDAARAKLQADLDKGAARDKSLVTSYEKSIEEMGDELKMHISTVGETSTGNARTGCNCSAHPSHKAVKQICF